MVVTSRQLPETIVECRFFDFCDEEIRIKLVKKVLIFRRLRYNEVRDLENINVMYLFYKVFPVNL
jgi:hypothetical protein